MILDKSKQNIELLLEILTRASRVCSFDFCEKHSKQRDLENYIDFLTNTFKISCSTHLIIVTIVLKILLLCYHNETTIASEILEALQISLI